MFCVVVVAAGLCPLLAPDDPRLPVGAPLLGPSLQHPLGTSDLGQDTLSRLLYGLRTSVGVAAAVTVISTALTWAVGLSAGFFRAAEGPLMALTDLLLAIPSLPLYLLVVTLIGPSTVHLVLVLALVSWPSFARVVRGVVLETRSAPYVEAAKSLGAPGLYILRVHILPATLDMLPSKLVLTVRFAVFAEATLAFLGLASSGSVSLGTMLSDAFDDPLLFARPVWPWLVLPPAAVLALLITATAWLSVGTRPSSISPGGTGRAAAGTRHRLRP